MKLPQKQICPMQKLIKNFFLHVADFVNFESVHVDPVTLFYLGFHTYKALN